MGSATIVGGGEEGRYTVSVDTGEAYRAAWIARLTAGITQLDTLIAKEVLKLEAAQLKLTSELRARVDLQTSVYVAAVNSGVKDSELAPLRLAYSQIMQVYQFELSKVTRQEALVNNYKLQRKNLIAKRERINALVLTFERGAWCMDLTEDGAPGTEVATVEIPGESDLILIANGCRPWEPGDGKLVDRALMSPEQAYFNAAILPGWQKWMPTHRWGTLSAVDYEANTATVTLGSATSSAQGLEVNQEEILEDVPVYYPDCHVNAFKDGDLAVVYFAGQAWTEPYIVGFAEHPRGCNFSCMGEGTEAGITGGLAFRSENEELHTRLFTESPVVLVRVNRGTWIEMTAVGSHDPGTTLHIFEAVFGGGGVDVGLTIMRSLPEDDPPHDRILCYVMPPLPPEVPARNIAEFAVYLGAELVLNLAMEDRGWDGYPNRGTGRVRCPGGIRLVPGSFAGVTRLNDYVLISD